MYLYICIYMLCILCVTYTYMAFKLLKDVTFLYAEGPSENLRKA